jgi:hypothetical protein
MIERATAANGYATPTEMGSTAIKQPALPKPGCGVIRDKSGVQPAPPVAKTSGASSTASTTTPADGRSSEIDQALADLTAYNFASEDPDQEKWKRLNAKLGAAISNQAAALIRSGE